jgi:NAD(P)-dependent dehydrogenase (short-subunit alcohol dehydrogenase family)
LPRQHLKNPGSESDLELKPMYDAPHYKGSEKLLDKVALIKGGDSGIGRAVAAGPVWTPLNPADKSVEKIVKFGSTTPMRPAQPEEIAPAFVFLAAPSCSSYITGEVLPIIGGYSGG